MQKNILLFLTFLLTLLFIVGGLRHLLTLKDSTNFLSTLPPFQYLPFSFNYLVIIVGSLIEFVAPLVILYSLFTNTIQDAAKIALYLLLFFLLCTLIFVHNPLYKDQMNPFLGNLSISAGLLFLDYYL